MKKLLTILMVVCTVCALAACGGKDAESNGSKIQKEEEKVTAVSAETVEVGNTISVDFADITVDEAGVADDIQTSIKTGYVTYTSGPSSSADKEFVYMRGTLQNTGKTSISSPEIFGSVEIDGYSYELASINIIESDGSSAHSIEPLMTYTYTLYAEVPNALVENFSDCKLNFNFDENFDNTRHYTNGEEQHNRPYNYTITITK